MERQVVEIKKMVKHLMGAQDDISDPLLKKLLSYYITCEVQHLGLQDTQMELIASKENFNNLYHYAPTPYFTINAKGVICDLNNAGVDLISVTKDQLLDKAFVRYVTPDTQGDFTSFLENLFKKKEKANCEIKMFKRPGSMIPVNIEGRIIVCPITQKDKLLLTIYDKSELNHRDLQAHSRISIDAQNKLIMAHEVNHPLGVIGNYIHGCIEKLQHDSYKKSDILQALQKTIHQLERASQIILKMKDFICYGKLELKSASIESLINEAMISMRNEFHHYPSTINFRCDKNIPELKLDQVHLQQVLLNLARNAMDAMKDSETSDPRLSLEVNKFGKKYIEIAIADNGPGFSPDIAHRLFEPCFTTKNYGMGLGLTFSKNIIESHGGTLRAEHNVTNGACFIISLPFS